MLTTRSTGTVVGKRGNPIPDAKVHLFTGDANPETWLRTLHPPMSGRAIAMRDTVLDAAVTDKHGRWRFWTVRERGEGMPMGNTDTDWTKYCIGVQEPDGSNQLVRNVVVPEGKARHELVITVSAE